MSPHAQLVVAVGQSLLAKQLSYEQCGPAFPFTMQRPFFPPLHCASEPHAQKSASAALQGAPASSAAPTLPAGRVGLQLAPTGKCLSGVPVGVVCIGGPGSAGPPNVDDPFDELQ